MLPILEEVQDQRAKPQKQIRVEMRRNFFRQILQPD